MNIFSQPGLRLALLCGGLVLSPLAAAHEFWIEPDAFQTAPGQHVALTLKVGQEFAGETVPYIPERIVKFVRSAPDGEHTIGGVLGDDPAGQFTATAAGRYSIALVTRPYEVIFDTGEEFESYLHKEGLERNLATHRARYKPGTKILETYFRCAKTLITVGGTSSESPDRALGLPLELVTESLTGREARLRLLYQSRPLEGALVLFLNRAEPKKRFTARTDAEGRVSATLPRAGVWLVNSVHMLKAPFYAREDWNSLWASVTFEVK
jgi:uncharacterized GH25 family protein